MRADSGFYVHALVAVCREMDVRFSITVRQHQSQRNLIEAIPEADWTPLPYWMDGAADVAETTYVPSQVEPDATPVRLIVRRVQPTPGSQLALFASYSYHGFITDREGETLALEADHRRHAEIENAIRDLKYGVGLNHLPSGRFAANAAWLAVQVIAHNLARWTARIGLGEQVVTTKTLLRRRFFSLAGLFRRQRAELPQRDLMGEAYLVVLTQLVGSAEASRERLEGTAIPDIDDGLADARATLLAEAHAAIDEMAEAVDADLREFNQDLPVEIRPAMRGLPAVTERAAAMVIGPADFYVGRFGEWDPNPPHAAGGLYIVYYYRGAKVVQSILDTYPLGFPAAAAQQQVDRVIGALLAMGPEAEALSDLLLPYLLVMSDLADAGLHDVAVDRCSEFVAALQEQDLRHGAMLEVLAAVAGDEPDVSEYLLRDSDFDPAFATLRQARAIITTARRQGLDSVKLSKLAAAMGHEAEELGVTPPSTDYATVSILLGAARAAGFPHDAIDRIYQAVDPDGYEDALYEQAAGLREFGEEDADGGLDGLPRFDGEFSR